MICLVNDQKGQRVCCLVLLILKCAVYAKSAAKPCFFKMVPHYKGNRTAIYTHALMAIASLQTPLFSSLPEATQENIEAQPACQSVTVIRCDEDDWLSDHYMTIVFANSLKASTPHTAHLTGIDRLVRHTIDINGTVPTCIKSKLHHRHFATSLGLAITVPSKNWRIVKSPHHMAENRLRDIFQSNLTVSKYNSTGLGYAPITRLSGSFKWNDRSYSKCHMPLPFKTNLVSAVLRIVSLVTFKDACLSNLWTKQRYNKLCPSYG